MKLFELFVAVDMAAAELKFPCNDLSRLLRFIFRMVHGFSLILNDSIFFDYRPGDQLGSELTLNIIGINDDFSCIVVGDVLFDDRHNLLKVGKLEFLADRQSSKKPLSQPQTKYIFFS